MHPKTLLPTLLVGATAILLVFAAHGPSASAEVSDSGSSETSSNYIYVGARGVDDKAEIWVDGQLMGSCNWATNSANCDFRVKVDMGSKTSADIRFRLTNYKYTGFCLGTCGKYTADFYVEGSNGVTEWDKSIACAASTSCSGANSDGVKYDHTVKWSK
jgi:hypothetical protein